MKKTVLHLLFVLTFSTSMNAQVGIGTITPDTSAALDISSQSKGLLIPRLTTTEISAITEPANGLMVFNNDLTCIQINKGTKIAPDFDCLQNEKESQWFDSTVNGSDYIFARKALRNNNDTVFITDKGALKIGSSAADLDSTLKFVVLTGDYISPVFLGGGPGSDIKLYNTLIGGSAENFNNPSTSQNYFNNFLLYWHPTADHKEVAGNNFATILYGSTNITGKVTSNNNVFNYLSTGTTEQVISNHNQVRTFAPGTINNAKSISIDIEAQNGGTIKNAYAISINQVDGRSSTGGTVENAYGLYIYDEIKGTNSSYGIYNNSLANNYFRGYVGVNTSNPLSSHDVSGSFGTAITTIDANITLDSSNHTIVITSNKPTITLPSASDAERRIYTIVNNTSNNPSISSITDIGGGVITTLDANTSYTIQSDSFYWYVINKSN